MVPQFHSSAHFTKSTESYKEVTAERIHRLLSEMSHSYKMTRVRDGGTSARGTGGGASDIRGDGRIRQGNLEPSVIATEKNAGSVHLCAALQVLQCMGPKLDQLQPFVRSKVWAKPKSSSYFCLYQRVLFHGHLIAEGKSTKSSGENKKRVFATDLLPSCTPSVCDTVSNTFTSSFCSAKLV